MIKGKSPHLLNVKEAALRARLAPITIYRRIYSGELPAYQPGGAHTPLRIKEDEFNEWLFGDPKDERVS